MKLQLVRFSQDVDLENLEATENFLVFRKEDGTTFRIPVPEETVQELLRQGAGGGKVDPAPDPDPEEQNTLTEEDPGWTEFGSEEDPAFRGQIQLDEEDLAEEQPSRQPRVPQNFLEDDEDGVPAL